MFDAILRKRVLCAHRSDTHWLSTGWDGGHSTGNRAYCVSVPSGWNPDDMAVDVEDRLVRAGFQRDGPLLLTALDLTHARGARLGPVEVFATAGISNPAALPLDANDEEVRASSTTESFRPGTVNLLVGTTRALPESALANLVAIAAEAKATTLLGETGFPGTTSDAVLVGCDPTGEPSEFSGSATPVGAATRACVREAILASLRSRYPDGAGLPESVEDAEYGVVTDERAAVFEP